MLHLTREALWLVLWLSAPPVVAASVVGLVVAVVQAVTQVQEQTTQYLFKFVAVVVSLLLTAGFLGGALVTFSARVLKELPGLVR